MQLIITGQHIEVTDALDHYVKQKLNKIKQHFDDVINVSVILNVVKNTQIAEATIHISGSDIFAKAETDDMYASIDQLVKKLDTQIIKYKEKHHNHRS